MEFGSNVLQSLLSAAFIKDGVLVQLAKTLLSWVACHEIHTNGYKDREKKFQADYKCPYTCKKIFVKILSSNREVSLQIINEPSSSITTITIDQILIIDKTLVFLCVDLILLQFQTLYLLDNRRRHVRMRLKMLVAMQATALICSATR